MLKKTNKELSQAKRLLKEKKRAIENANDKPQKAAAKYSRKTVKTAIEGLEEHREVLLEQATK